MQDQLYGPLSANHAPATTVQLVHLQKDTHWDNMCDYTGQICALCDPTISQNKHNMRRAYELLKPLIPTTANPPKAAGFSHASVSSGGTSSTKATSPPAAYVPAKAQPAALTRTTQAALLPPTAIGAAPRRASSPPISVLAAAAAEAASARGTARTSQSVPIPGTTRNMQSSSSCKTITPQQLHDLHRGARIVVDKRSAQESRGASLGQPARKDDRPREDRTEKERSRGTEDTRREKAESLHAPVTRKPSEADTSIENLKVLVNGFNEDISVLVINEICKFYFREDTFFELVRQHVDPESCLLHLCKKHPDISYEQLIELFNAFDERSTSSSSTTLKQVKQEDNEDEKEDLESNSSKEFNELQAKCDDPDGTTYRLRDRRAAPVSPAAATAGSPRSISPDAEDNRTENLSKRIIEA